MAFKVLIYTKKDFGIFKDLNERNSVSKYVDQNQKKLLAIIFVNDSPSEELARRLALKKMKIDFPKAELKFIESFLNTHVYAIY